MPRKVVKTVILEEMYWHICNSGCTIRILEHRREALRLGGLDFEYDIEVRFGAFGLGTSFRIPVMADMPSVLAGALTRLNDRLESLRSKKDRPDSVCGDHEFCVRVEPARLSESEPLDE